MIDLKKELARAEGLKLSTRLDPGMEIWLDELQTSVDKQCIEYAIKVLDGFFDKYGDPEDNRWTVLHEDLVAKLSELRKQLEALKGG